MIVEEAAVAGGHKLFDLLALAIPIDDAQAAVLDGGRVLSHALPAHVLVAGEVMEVIALRSLMANDALSIMFGAAKDGDSGPNDATGAESSFYLPVRILGVNRIGGRTASQRHTYQRCLQD